MLVTKIPRLITIKLHREGSQWCGECVELGTGGCGDTFVSAGVCVVNLVDLHLRSLSEAENMKGQDDD